MTKIRCQWCGETFFPREAAHVFCSGECRARFHIRERSRALAFYRQRRQEEQRA